MTDFSSLRPSAFTPVDASGSLPADVRKERAELIAGLIEANAAHFAMDTFLRVGDEIDLPVSQAVHACGTTACIAGWCVVADRPDTPANHVWRSASQVGRQFLGLSYSAGSELFYTYTIGGDAVTPAQAAATLRHYGETGEVVWGL